MRLLCATQFFAPGVGGMQISNTLLVEGLAEHGMEIELLVFGQEGEDGSGERVRRRNHPFDGRSLSSLHRAASEVVAHVRRAPPDCVLLLDEGIVRGFGTLALPRRRGIPFASVNSGSTLTRGDRHFRGRANAWLVRRGYAWLERLFVARATAEELPATYPAVAARVRELGRPLPDAFFEAPAAPERLRQLVGDDRPILFSAARAEEDKGIGLVLEALARLRDRAGAERVHFVYAGDGPALGEWRTRVERDRLGAVHFLGSVPLETVRDGYDGAWMGIFPSLSETFGRTWVESFARGLPVISTTSANLRYLVREGENALVVQPTAESVTTGIERALALSPAEHQRMRTAAVASARPYRKREIVDRLIRGIEEIV